VSHATARNPRQSRAGKLVSLAQEFVKNQAWLRKPKNAKAWARNVKPIRRAITDYSANERRC
jgi:hypothetical protein